MKLTRGAAQHVGIAGGLSLFFWNNARWWLLPMVVVVVAPFIYTLF